MSGHKGPFAGWHGRYVLRSRVDITGKTTPPVDGEACHDR